MKKLFWIAVVVGIILAVCNFAFADVYVNGYYRSNGTYVQPHYRSSPNSTTSDNWSTKGNQNPYTGKWGTTPNNPYSGGGMQRVGGNGGLNTFRQSDSLQSVY